MRRIFGSIVMIFIMIQFAGAQQKKWTFQACLDTALKRNITVNQVRLSNENNKINLMQSKANRIPSLAAGANENLNFGKNINPNSNSYVVETYNSTSFSVNGGLNLFNGLQNNMTIRQDKMNVDAGQYDIEKAKNDLILSIASAYLQVLFSYEILTTAQSQADADAVQVERTEKMVNAGKVAESNLFTIKSQYATDKLAIVNAQSQLDLARVTLMQLMEIPVQDSFDIEKPRLEEPTMMLLQSNHEIYQKALSVQPQIAGASIRTNASLLGIKINQGAYWPRLNLNGNVNTNFAASSQSSSGGGVNPNKDPFFTQVWNNLGESVGLSLAIPIYSNRQVKSSVEKAKVNALSTQLNEQNTKNQLRKSIEQSYTDLKNSMNKYFATKDQLAAADDSYKNMEKKYNVGMVTAIDYLVEKNNFYLAQSNLIQAHYDLIFKTKILDFYQGKAITF
jgi:outer membrane protein